MRQKLNKIFIIFISIVFEDYTKLKFFFFFSKTLLIGCLMTGFI